MFEIDNIERSFKDLLKINILSQIETGNLFFDTIIKMLLITIITTFSGKIFLWIENINILNYSIRNMRSKIYFWWKQPKKILISGSRYVELRFMHSRLDFSMRFNAFLEKIVNSAEKRPNNNKFINKIRELQTREKIKYIDDSREYIKDFHFIVDQDQYFELDDNIYCNINSSKHDLENEKKATITKEEYNIEIWSDKLNCSQLIQYVERITDEYEKKQLALTANKRYIFKFDGRHEERGIQWQISEFVSKRSLEQVFFENKKEVMSFLEQFIKERDLYESIGKPWQLGILLEGEPGCGKTSFIVGLANYLNRSIKDCQFNRMKTIDDLENCIQCVNYDSKDMSVDKVIMVAEDFDCMTDIAKSRKLADKELENEKKRIEKRREALKQQMDSMKSDEGKAIMYALGQQQEMDATYVSSSSVVSVVDKDNCRKITLSNLLNIMDGINNMPGRILIFSTNHSEQLDEAFLRPGRIDLRIRLERPSRPIIREIMEHWYGCIDQFYKGKRLGDQFKRLWKQYEKRIPDRKLRPCDITNLLQKHGDNMENVFKELVSTS